jgi:uncharacterized circularly permuted ATP-grasp superfamily protein/uncharacterized alpha-E superfamily protein
MNAAVEDPLPLWARDVPPARAGTFDELREPLGALRPLWAEFGQHLPAEDVPAWLDERTVALQEAVARDGITYNLLKAKGEATRPWAVQALPLLISDTEWLDIERGVVQRARLLQAMLADAYGPQTMLSTGLLPASLLHRHSGYLPALHGVVPVGGAHLQIAAFDLARGPDGRFWLLGQRTQAPSGLGYLLHNRLLVSRQLPQAFGALRVQHIASTYRHLLDGLLAQASVLSEGAAPQLVLLTPGPYSETYFEHVVLARYLGLPLVEGGDMVVRADRLYLKTVQGLTRVHGVLRRLDEGYCDPLELRPDSTLGIPGLVQAVRAQQVAMANALGSGWLESPAVMGFMPAVAQALLGESLLLPQAASWWCGEAAAWAEVQAALDGKRAQASFEPAARPLKEAQDIRSAVQADPDGWTLQADLAYSRAPLWADGRLLVRPAVVRVYAINGANGQWQVLPGGMTRLSSGQHQHVTMQEGGVSLDTWVQAAGPVDTFTMLSAPTDVQALVHRPTVVASRTAENMFWLGRYTERAEQAIRTCRAVLMLQEAGLPEAVTQAIEGLEAWIGAVPGSANLPGSLVFHLEALRRCAHAVRERLSAEHWQWLQTLGQGFAALPAETANAELVRALDECSAQLAAITGGQTDRMTRDHGWRFLTVGRLLERLTGQCRQLQVLLATEALGHPRGVELALAVFDSTITFRARHQHQESLLHLAEALVCDDTNPRALAGVLRRLRTELPKLPGDANLVETLRTAWPKSGAGIELLALHAAGPAAAAASLAAVCQALRTQAAIQAERLTQRYFAHSDDTLHAS